MAFHLEGPWLSTTGKKKGPKKWASSEAKAKAEALDQQWRAKLKAMGVDSENKKQKRSLAAPALSVKIMTPPGRETAPIASQDTGWVPCTKKTDTIYTGTKCLGVSVLHKSNGIPVFSQDEVVEISKMRR
jgi:hypothetical protein